MRTREQQQEPFVNLAEITEIELLILKQMKDFTVGEHRSQFQGSGFDFLGLRDWEAGDRLSHIDWPQSSLKNFSPLVIRQYQQPSTASVIAVADASRSTRCGMQGTSISAIIARTIATIGISAVFFQDQFGMITFKEGFTNLSALPARVGKNHVIHSLDAYQYQRGLQELRQAGSISRSIASFLRKTALVPVISDFLFDNVSDVIKELALLNAQHDVFVVIVDSTFAFHLPAISCGWIELGDIETGETRVISSKAARGLAGKIASWQNEVEAMAKDSELDCVRVGVDEVQSSLALNAFIAERRLRRH